MVRDNGEKISYLLQDEIYQRKFALMLERISYLSLPCVLQRQSQRRTRAVVHKLKENDSEGRLRGG